MLRLDELFLFYSFAMLVLDYINVSLKLMAQKLTVSKGALNAPHHLIDIPFIS